MFVCVCFFIAKKRLFKKGFYSLAHNRKKYKAETAEAET